MKYMIVVLLLVIAAGVGYLAYTKYQERQAVKRFAEAVADPGAYVVKQWSGRAKLECEYGISDVVTRQAPGGTFPASFTCKAPTGSWAIVERRCTDEETAIPRDGEGLAYGAPKRVGEVFRPLHTLCWEVSSQN